MTSWIPAITFGISVTGNAFVFSLGGSGRIAWFNASVITVTMRGVGYEVGCDGFGC